MLRKLKIGTRVNVLIAVPLAALIVLAAVSFVSLQRSSVRGQEYKDLKLAQDLRTDLVPPRANLIAAWSSVSKIGVLVASPATSRTTAEIQAELQKLDVARADYFAAVDFWRTQNLPADQRDAFEGGAASGSVFFDKVDSLLLSSMGGDRDVSIVLNAVRAIEYDYNIQQIYVGQSLELVQEEVAGREQSTNDFVGSVQLLIIAAVAALMLLLLVIAFFVRRSIVRPILALSAQARQAATTDLPEAVRQIQSMPADAPRPSIEMFHTSSDPNGRQGKDELADLSASFNSVQSAALDLASEQAIARRIVSENLINIARRTQSLLGRSLGSLSDMEESERNPETLAKLFRLDHLTTRMRRNAQSLLVLADAEQNRLWSAPVPVGDVVRAALSEIENYARVDLGDLGDHGRVMVQGSLAADVAHLLAELLENATSFSSPSTKVMVVGRSIGNGHQLAIVDYGIGMSQDELDAANDSLRRQSDFGAESSKVLGFQVVARIAARLRIQVVLANTAGATGITAIIKLPPELFDSRIAPAVTASNGARILPPPSAAGRDAQMPAPGSTLTVESPSSPSESISDAELWAMVEPSDPAVDRITDSAAVQHIVDPVPAAPPSAGAAVAPAPRVTPARAAAPSTAPVAAVPAGSNGGLTKRVRGAQLPDLGAAATPTAAGWERPAEEVRNSLSSLQRGTDLARQRQTPDHVNATDRDQELT
ncbi:MAG: ATP-binding protein [Ilumatobacteraceae bacterium]